MFCGSIPALITPFNEKEQIDYPCLEKLLLLHLRSETSAIAIAGTTGEGPTLEDGEVQTLIPFCKNILKKKIPLLVGTGSNSTKKTITKTENALRLGADGALVIVPYYNKPTDAGCLEHFKRVASVGLPIVAYHHPGRTGKTMSVSSLVDLLAIPGIVSLKEASGDLGTTKGILQKNPKGKILSGDDPLAIEQIKIGACGSISILANLFPKEWSQLIQTALKGDFQDALEKYRTLSKPLEKILCDGNPVGIKKAMHHHGLCKNIVRLPLVTH